MEVRHSEDIQVLQVTPTPFGFFSRNSDFDSPICHSSVIMRRAIEHVVSDQSFHIPVEPAATALGIAKSVLEWVSKEENQSIFAEFERNVMTELHPCLGDCPKDMRSFRTKRIELCRSYHLLRVSERFTTSWRDFLMKVGCAAVPSFYQEVTDLLFEDMLKSTYPLPTDDTHSVAEDINYEDANVVRYVAGYVYRKVSAKIAKTPKTPNQLQLEKCLKELLQEEGESAATASANWLEAVDRGGLVHVSEGTYMLFCAMEEVVREYLHANKVHHMTEGFKSTVVKAIMENEEVLFHWCMLTAEAEDKDAEVVFGMLVDMWITVRGF